MQGYRMWDLGAPLLLTLLYPGSLLLPAIYGFLTQLITSSLTTQVGDWIDASPRMKSESIAHIIKFYYSK